MNVRLEFQYPQVMQIGPSELALKNPKLWDLNIWSESLSQIQHGISYEEGFVSRLVHSRPSAWTLQLMMGMGQGHIKVFQQRTRKERDQTFMLCPKAQMPVPGMQVL